MMRDPKRKQIPAEDRMRAWLESLPLALNLRFTLEMLERALLLRALEAANGVQAEAARRLGISRSDMAYKVKKYDLVP